jgi:hypothetical protein
MQEESSVDEKISENKVCILDDIDVKIVDGSDDKKLEKSD